MQPVSGQWGTVVDNSERGEGFGILAAHSKQAITTIVRHDGRQTVLNKLPVLKIQKLWFTLISEVTGGNSNFLAVIGVECCTRCGSGVAPQVGTAFTFAATVGSDIILMAVLTFTSWLAIFAATLK